MVRLLECTAIRVGNDEYARANRSFGLTTLRDHHVRGLRLDAPLPVPGQERQDRTRWRSATGGSRGSCARCQALPGAELFQYVDDDGARVTIGSGDVNEYLREITGEDFTAKDFRTWAGTLQAVAALRRSGPRPPQREAKSAILRAIDRVAEQLNNTRAVCRKYYVHPAVLESYEAGTLHEALANGKGRRPPPTGLEPGGAGAGPPAPGRGRTEPTAPPRGRGSPASTGPTTATGPAPAPVPAAVHRDRSRADHCRHARSKVGIRAGGGERPLEGPGALLSRAGRRRRR